MCRNQFIDLKVKCSAVFIKGFLDNKKPKKSKAKNKIIDGIMKGLFVKWRGDKINDHHDHGNNKGDGTAKNLQCHCRKLFKDILSFMIKPFHTPYNQISCPDEWLHLIFEPEKYKN